MMPSLAENANSFGKMSKRAAAQLLVGLLLYYTRDQGFFRI